MLVVVYDGPQLGQGADPVLGVIRSSASTYLLKEYIYLCLGGMVVLNYFPCTSVHFLYYREMEKNMQHICLFVIIIKYTIFSSKPSRWRVMREYWAVCVSLTGTKGKKGQGPGM